MTWKRLPGLSRRYLNTDTGANISYRQYRVLFEASEQYRPLDLPALARAQFKQRRYNDLVATKYKAKLARVISGLDLRAAFEEKYGDDVQIEDIDPREIERVERGAMKSVSKAAILRSPEFKSDVKTLKRISKIKHQNRTAQDELDIIIALENLGRREGISRSVREGDSDKQMLRRARDRAAAGVIHRPASRTRQQIVRGR